MQYHFWEKLRIRKSPSQKLFWRAQSAYIACLTPLIFFFFIAQFSLTSSASGLIEVIILVTHRQEKDRETISGQYHKMNLDSAAF